MSLYEKATLVQIPSGYKASSAKLYSVLPTDGDGDFTISAVAEATRVNSDGLIESVSANQARLDYDPSNPQDPHLLLEPTRKNEVKYSEDFSSGWSVARGTATTSTTETTAPDGSNNAVKYEKTESSNEGYYFRTDISVSAVGTFYVSFFAKRNNTQFTHFLLFDGGSNGARGWFDIENGTIGGTTTFGSTFTVSDLGIEEYPNSWYRCSAKVVVTGTDTTWTFRLNPSNSNTSVNSTDGDIVYWAFPQIEAGTYASSYIPTTSAAVTRTTDGCFINSGLADILNTSEGTLFFDLEVPRVSTSSDYERIALTDQASSTDRILFDTYNGNWRIVVISSAGTSAVTVRSVQANTRIKVAFTYSSSQIRVSYYGYDATTTSISYTPSTTLESFKFSNKDGNNKWQGKVYQAMYFDTALSDSELETLTSYTSFNEMAKALLYTIE